MVLSAELAHSLQSSPPLYGLFHPGYLGQSLQRVTAPKPAQMRAVDAETSEPMFCGWRREG